MKKEKTENIKTGKSEQKKSVNRTLACSFKGFCSILKSREEIEADNESTTEQQEQQLQEKQLESSVADEVQEVECARIQERVNEEETHSIHAERLPSGEMPPTVCQSLLESQYKTANLPAGRRFQAGITFVDSQGYIYAQEVREGDRTLINIMSELLRKYGKGDDVTANPSTREATVVTPGLPCCAQYAEDGMWYRGRVVKFIDDEKVEVNYVDFGNSEVVSLSALRQERPFMDVPQQCLELVLHGVEPKTRDGHWPPKTISALSQLTVGQDCIAYIRGDKLPGYPLVVNLTLPDGTDVAQALLRNGLVQQSPTLLDTENPAQFSPKKTKPSKVKQKQSSRSITETREQAHKISSREAECVLAQTELPEDGIRFDVTITHIEQPDCLFIQRVPPSGADMRLSDDPDPTLETATYELRMLEQMMTKINAPEYFKKYPPLSTASQGMLCCAQYTEDDMWYRAQVKQVECEKPLQVQVLYVDYGTTEVIKADRLRGFPSELLDLPIQSTHCYIADVIPPDRWEGPMMDDKQWPVDTMETLLKLVAGKKLVAKTMFRGPPVSIMLYDHRTREDGCTEEVSIGLLLAQEGLAMSRDPDLGEVGKSALSEQYNSEPDKLLELPEMGLNFRHATSGTEAESKENISSNVLLENILAPKVGFGPAVSPTKQPLLSPSTFTAKIEEMTAKNSDLTCQEAATSPVIEQETGDQPHEQALAEPLKIDHVTNKSAVAAEVNEHYVESSV